MLVVNAHAADTCSVLSRTHAAFVFPFTSRYLDQCRAEWTGPKQFVAWCSSYAAGPSLLRAPVQALLIRKDSPATEPETAKSKEIWILMEWFRPLGLVKTLGWIGRHSISS